MEQQPNPQRDSLKYAREAVLFVSIAGAIYLGQTNPQAYAETTKLVLVSAISGYFGMSIPEASKLDK